MTREQTTFSVGKLTKHESIMDTFSEPTKATKIIPKHPSPVSRHLLVIGFIRQHQKNKNLPGQYLSVHLIQLMSRWLFFEDTFDVDVSHSELRVKDIFCDGQVQSLCGNGLNTSVLYSSRFAFGTKVVSRGQNEYWIFKMGRHFACLIGIVDAVLTLQRPSQSTDFDFTNSFYKGYGYYTLDCSPEAMTHHIHATPIEILPNIERYQYLKMELDLSCRKSDSGILSFSVYGADKELITSKSRIAFDNIDVKRTYKLAILSYEMLNGGEWITVMNWDTLDTEPWTWQDKVEIKEDWF